MNGKKTLTELDTIRSEEMRSLLNEEGCQHIWMYDVMRRTDAFREAVYNDSFDNMQVDGNSNCEFVLVGPGIEDCPFDTEEELREKVRWLCTGYLGCYQKYEN